MGVETYLTVVFWLGLLAIGGLLFLLFNGHYPRVKNIDMRQDCLQLCITLFFFVWVCFLKFGG